MFTSAKLLAVVGERVKIPAVLSEFAAAILSGPHLLGVVKAEEWTLALAELGAIVLLFDVGLDQKLTDLMKVGWTVLLVAVVGVVVPFFLGFGLLELTEHSRIEAIFMGAAMVATSVGITARVLQELGVLKTVVATVILGAAVIDDILGMIVLAVVSSLSEGVNYVQIGSVTALAVGFTLFIVLAGLVTLLAILGKLVGCGRGAYRLGWRSAIQVGVGMVPRGEVGIIVASIGLGLHTISNEIYAVVIIMVLVTTLIAPPAMKLLFAEKKTTGSPLSTPSDLL